MFISKKILLMLIDWSNSFIDISAINDLLSNLKNSFDIILEYLKGVFYILPFDITMVCISVIVAVLVIRIVLAVINLLYP